MRRRSDFRSVAKGYFKTAAEDSAEGGSGLGRRMARGGEANESNSGKKL